MRSQAKDLKNRSDKLQNLEQNSQICVNKMRGSVTSSLSTGATEERVRHASTIPSGCVFVSVVA